MGYDRRMEEPSTPLMASLREVYLFSALTEEQLASIIASMRKLDLSMGQRLFAQGQAAEHFFLVQSGQIKLYRLSEDGDEKVIEIIKPGQSFAEAVMFMSGRAYPVNAEAISDAHILAFDSSLYLTMLRDSVDTCFRLMGTMSQRLHRQLNEIDGITLHNATFRLVTFLLNELPREVVQSPRICLTTPKHVIASRLSIQPETFSRLLAKLARDGLIEIQGTSLVLTDLPRLRELAASHEPSARMPDPPCAPSP